jgi:beta-fructofuranosidase
VYRFKIILFLSLVIGLTSCGHKPQVTNYSFETGNFTTWKVEGDAFTVSDALTYADGERYYLADKTYHVLGNTANRGKLQSKVFTISASGYISFLLSGGKDADTTYVAIKLAKGNKEIKRVTNEYYLEPFQTETYVRFNVDLSSYLGDKVYVEIVDESTTSHINFDDLRVSISEDELVELSDDTNIRLGIARAEDMVEAADIYIKLNAWKVDRDKRFAYHLHGQIGWINDPNGFSYYNDKVHLFYQYNPYGIMWGPMHWGHATTDDFVKWKYEKVALAPDQPYDSGGAFSGSAISDEEGTYYLMYTGASTSGQVQAIATSSNGVNFTKYEGNPVLSENDLPPNATIADFRDPKVFKKDNDYYAIISSRHTNNDYSSLLLYKSRDLYKWSYAGRTFSNGPEFAARLGIMLECPDLFNLDGQDMIIVSPQTATGHRNSDGNVYITGNMNWQTGVLENVDYRRIVEIDDGFDFYAPQTMKMPDGRTMMVAWMAGWNRAPVTREFGYAGAMTFPRELSYVNNRLMQKPACELYSYLGTPIMVTIEEVVTNYKDARLDGRVKHLKMETTLNSDITEFTLFGDEEGNGIKLTLSDDNLKVDRSSLNHGHFPQEGIHNVINVPITTKANKVKLEILLDKYSAEIFVNDGEKVVTLTSMTTEQNRHLFISNYGANTINITAADIGV